MSKHSPDPISIIFPTHRAIANNAG